MPTGTEQFLEVQLPRFLSQLAELERGIDPSSSPADDALLGEVTRAVDDFLALCSQLEAEIGDDTRLLRQTQEQFRTAIQPWFQQSWYMNHALTKPRGYAGDYLMLTAVYDRKVRSTGIGGYLDRYFLQTELGRSVPIRLQMAREFLQKAVTARGGRVRILNVASGPGREYRGGWELPAECYAQVTCIDQDDEAIAFVQQEVIPTLPSNMSMKMVKYNALKMGNAALNREHLGECDILYSVGLCDYIPDRLMIRLLEGWRETVADDGLVYVAFKDCRQYDKAKYQWLVDWYFYQRTEDECRQLFAQAGYDMLELEMTRDDTGSIINFISRQHSPAAVPDRVETSHPVATP